MRGVLIRPEPGWEQRGESVASVRAPLHSIQGADEVINQALSSAGYLLKGDLNKTLLWLPATPGSIFL